MNILITLAFLCFLHTIAGQVNKDGSDVNKIGSANKVQELNTNQNVNNKQPQVVAQNQHVDESQHYSEQSKQSVKVPPKVQHVNTQVAQHIPQVVTQHVANKQRMVRSIKNRLAGQSIKVEKPGKCEFLCHQLDVTVCGHNGRCYWEFTSQCDLSNYNCLNSQKVFHVVDFAKCQDVSAAKCYRGDM